MKLGLDTSVVLRLLTGEPAGMAAVCGERLEAAARAGDRVVVSDLVVLEAYHALQFHYELPKERAREAIARMFRSGQVEPDRPETAEAYAPAAGAGPVDRLIHSRYAALGARTLTFDDLQSRLAGAERLRERRHR
ncbi:MAG: hypothetical protein FD180_702 [Planctomycetota bacterium]|nr:MAG: hypothetical protein FD180_702 [Planctomycetota bacterium]